MEIGLTFMNVFIHNPWELPLSVHSLLDSPRGLQKAEELCMLLLGAYSGLNSKFLGSRGEVLEHAMVQCLL